MRFTEVTLGPEPAGTMSSGTTRAPETVPPALVSEKSRCTSGSAAKRSVLPPTSTSGFCAVTASQSSSRDERSFQSRHSPSASSTVFSPAIRASVLYWETGTTVRRWSVLPCIIVCTVALPVKSVLAKSSSTVVSTIGLPSAS